MWRGIESLACLKRRDGQEGHKVDDGRSRLNWGKQGLGWFEIERKDDHLFLILRGSSHGRGRAGVFHWVGDRRVGRIFPES